MAPPRLITIPISHFCEKARWALDNAGVEYVEEPHVQLVHRLVSERVAGSATVPVLVTDDRVLSESAAIVEYADSAAPPERRLAVGEDSRALVRSFDAELGPHARRWMYHRFLAAPQLADTNSWHAPVRERQMFAAFFVPMRWVGKRYLNVTPESAAASERVVWRTFDEVGERLADGRPYLAGERFGVEDLTFACMAAAVLVPPHYGVPLPQPGQDLPEEWSREVEAFRRHPAGRHGLRLFANERREAAARGVRRVRTRS